MEKDTLKNIFNLIKEKENKENNKVNKFIKKIEMVEKIESDRPFTEDELNIKGDLDLSNSLLIGDNLSDMHAGESAGVSKLYLINNPPVSSEHFESYINLKECLVRLRNVFNV